MRVKQAAVAGGLVWGVTIFLTTLANIYFGYGTAFLEFVKSIYPGYNLNLLGSVVGLVYGFVDMFVGIYIMVWVYKWVGNYVK